MRKIFTFLTAALIILVINTGKTTAQNDYEIEQVKKNLPNLLGANNVGKEFWMTIPPCFEDEASGFPNFIKLFITSPIETQVVVEVPGKGFYQTKKTIANDVIEFNLSPVVGSPWTKTGSMEPPAEKIFKGYGIHVTADDPLVVYCVVRYRWSSDGFLAIPVSSFGKEYIVASYGSMEALAFGYYMPSETGVVAAYDKTTVKFTLGGNDQTQTAGGMLPGQTKTYNMNAGDVVMVPTIGAEADVTGSKWIGSKPIGVVSGNYCTNIPTTNRWCDYTVEMDIPTFTWGLHYHVGKVPRRFYPPLIRIFSKEPMTKIYRDGAAVGNITTAGGSWGKGYLEMRLVPLGETPASAVISGDKPIGVTLYNPGIQEDQQAGNYVNSDPFIMAQTPMEQYQKEITFCTPGINGGQNFPENYINLVYQTNEDGLMPADMQFAQVSGGEFVWQQLRTRFPGADEQFKFDIDGKHYAMKNIVLPGDGVFKIKSDLPFAAYSFGYSDYDSYGYPTSAALMDLEKPDTVAPDPDWEEICGNVEGAVVTDMPNDVEVRSNLAMIVFHSEESFNYIFDYDDFIPGETISTEWSLEVIDSREDARAVITFTDRRGNDTTISIEYFANRFDIVPKQIDFGRLKKGDYDTKTFTVVNTSDTYEGDLTKIELKSGNQNFTLHDLDMNPISLPFHVKPLESFDFIVKFDALAEGSYIDSIGIGDECKFEYITEVKGEVGEPMIFVSDHDYGAVSVGDASPWTFSIKNNGSTDLIITGYEDNTLGVFTHDLENLGISDDNPLVINPKKERTFNVDFRPDAEQNYVDSIVFISNAGRNRDNVCNIKGLGIKPGLSANSYDWGRIRIHRTTHPVPPYDTKYVPGLDEAIMLENTGTAALRVSGIQTDELNTGDAAHFKLPPDLISGFTLEPGEQRLFPVTCQPTEVGEHQITISYINDAESQATSVLRCVGILPRIETYDVDFGITLVKPDPAEKEQLKVQKMVTIKNLNYDWEDAVTIDNLVVKPNAGDISDVINVFGNEGFRYSKSSLSLPVTLEPGESIEFPAEFVAMRNGDHSASLETVSDAESEVETKWHGFGESKGIDGTGGSITTCVGVEAQIEATVRNTGTTDLNITSVYFDPIIGTMGFDNINDKNGFVLKPGEERTVVINYLPIAPKEETVTTDLVFENDSEDELFSVELQGSSMYFVRQTEMGPFMQYVSIGEQAKIDIVLKDSEKDMKPAGVKNIDLTVHYNNAFLGIISSNITPGGAAQGFTVENVDIDQDNGILKFTLQSGGNPLSIEGVLASLTFDAYLPVSASDSSFIETEIDMGDYTCALIEGSNGNIVLNRICALNIRHVNNLFGQYELGLISPNPVGSQGANVDFSVALDGWVSIRIVDATGQLVSVPLSDYLKKGDYELPLPVDDLSSGVYRIEMISGDFRQSRNLVIAK